MFTNYRVHKEIIKEAIEMLSTATKKKELEIYWNFAYEALSILMLIEDKFF